MTSHSTPARDQSFLEESSEAAHNRHLRTNPQTPRPTTQTNDPRDTSTPIVEPTPGPSHQTEPHNYNFYASMTLPRQPPTMQNFNTPHDQSLHQVDMPFAIDHWAADRLMAEQIHDYAQPPSPARNHSLAALIALAPSMNQQERDALSNRMLTRVNAMVQILQSQPTGARNRGSAHTPPRPERGEENALLQDLIASPYAVDVWDDADLLDLDFDAGVLDTASRSFYPDLFPLVTVPYV